MENDRNQSYHLSAQQKSAWVRQEIEGVLVARCQVYLRGKVQPEQLENAITRAVQRHAILRTTFSRLSGIGNGAQSVGESAKVNWWQRDWAKENEREQARLLDALWQSKKTI
jgi:phage tail tape-measure protein